MKFFNDGNMAAFDLEYMRIFLRIYRRKAEERVRVVFEESTSPRTSYLLGHIIR